MRSVFTGLLVAVLGLGVPGAAQAPSESASLPPFWDAQPYDQWTPAELIQLFTDSPWSRSARLIEPGVDIRLGNIQYYAQWYSARTIREALVRQRHLKGITDAQAEREFLEGPPSAYQLYLFAAFITDTGGLRVVPLDALQGMTREQLEAGARLIFSAQEHTARPDLVELITTADTQQLVGLRLTFERARAAVPPEEARSGQVRLVCPTRNGSLSARFDLSEMRRQARPDL